VQVLGEVPEGYGAEKMRGEVPEGSGADIGGFWRRCFVKFQKVPMFLRA